MHDDQVIRLINPEAKTEGSKASSTGDQDGLRRCIRMANQVLNRNWQAGDVVQLNPETVRAEFAGCFMLITEPKTFGAVGFVKVPGQGDAYYRAGHKDMHRIGEAEWHPTETGETLASSDSNHIQSAKPVRTRQMYDDEVDRPTEPEDEPIDPTPAPGPGERGAPPAVQKSD